MISRVIKAALFAALILGAGALSASLAPVELTAFR